QGAAALGRGHQGRQDSAELRPRTNNKAAADAATAFVFGLRRRQCRGRVITFSVAGVPERILSMARSSAGITASAVSTFSPKPPQVSTTFSKSGEGRSSVSGMMFAFAALPSG